jgi:rhodanese-related sulfurtransferase
MPNRARAVVTLFALLLVGSLSASTEPVEVKIDERLGFVDVTFEGQIIRIQRIQDQENVLTGGFAKTSRKCPPFCIHPMQVAPGVATVGELELIEFIKQHVERGTGILIDARTPEWHTKGTIPASVNLPFTTFTGEDNSPEMLAALARFGVMSHTPGFIEKLWAKLWGKEPARWDFRQAKELLLWCNGPWCDQSPRAIKGLLKLGYPAAKMRYYRGGMQDWAMLGLTVVVPGAELKP